MPVDPALITGRLNVNDFVKARQDEIKKLEVMLGSSGSNSRKRAFQSLPRTERRRAASHDPRRVPRKKGLRKRTELEIIRENAKKSKSRKRPPPKLPEYKQQDNSTVGSKASLRASSIPGLRYGHRQKDKIWLPTHIWHKKRAVMTPFAGTIIPQTATQKQYRKAYRLTSHIDQKGSIAWDSSYYATMVVRNVDTSVIERAFPQCGLDIYRGGLKHWQGIANGEGPALLIWIGPSSAVIQCNPLLFEALWDCLDDGSVELEDCRYAIGSIDIIGANKFKVALEGLKPISIDPKSEETWKEIKSLGAAPSRFVMHGLFCDPRLASNQALKTSSKTKNSCLLYCKQARQASLDRQLPQSVIDHYRTDSTRHDSDAEIPVTVLVLDDERLRVMLPRGWVLPFWLATFKRGRVTIGGQLELSQLAFEDSVPCYPYDFPHTSSGLEFANQAHENLIGAKNSRPQESCASQLTAISKFVCPGREYVHVVVSLDSKGVPCRGDEISNSDNEVVGVITTGSFGLAAAKGVGIGLCIKGKEKSSQFILRNKMSKTYKCKLQSVTNSAKVL